MYKIYYRIVIEKVLIGPLTLPIMSIGFPVIDSDGLPVPPPAGQPHIMSTILSLNKANGIGVAWNRKFQAANVDCRYHVFAIIWDQNGSPLVGIVVDPVPLPSEPIAPLPWLTSLEYLFTSGDTAEHEILQRIHRANTPKSAISAAIVTDLPEDVLTP